MLNHKMERIVLCDNEKDKDDKERKGNNNQGFFYDNRL